MSWIARLAAPGMTHTFWQGLAAQQAMIRISVTDIGRRHGHATCNHAQMVWGDVQPGVHCAPPQKSLKMPLEQRKGIRALRRLYLGRLGDVLRQRQAINAQLRSAVPSVEGGRQLAHEYLTVRRLRCQFKWLSLCWYCVPGPASRFRGTSDGSMQPSNLIGLPVTSLDQHNPFARDEAANLRITPATSTLDGTCLQPQYFDIPGGRWWTRPRSCRRAWRRSTGCT